MNDIIDVFVMDTLKKSPTRSRVETVAAVWWCSATKDLPFRVNLTHIRPNESVNGYEFAINARQMVFTCPGSDLFILTDNDMLPFSADHVAKGVETIRNNPEFAILSAWPDPHDFRKIALQDREPIETDKILETYSCGGMRFCRKVPGLSAPGDQVKGYDGVFCRHLWSEHGMRVGYMKQSRAFHLGAHCTTLWVD